MAFDFGAAPQPEDWMVEAFGKAKGLISDPRFWLKGSAFSGRAMCTVGALHRAIVGHVDDGEFVPSGKMKLYHDAMNEVSLSIPRSAGTSVVSTYNDDWNTTHADIMALFDRAIERRRVAVLTDAS